MKDTTTSDRMKTSLRLYGVQRDPKQALVEDVQQVRELIAMVTGDLNDWQLYLFIRMLADNLPDVDHARQVVDLIDSLETTRVSDIVAHIDALKEVVDG